MDHKLYDKAQSSSVPAPSQAFQSRPFEEQEETRRSQTDSPNPDLQAQVDRANQFSHHFSQVQVKADPPVIQPKLTIGEPHDRYEQEADQMAEKVMRMAAPPVNPNIQRQTEEEEWAQPKLFTSIVQRELDEEVDPLQRKPLLSSISPLVQRQNDEEEDTTLQLQPAIFPLIQRQDGSSVMEASPSLESRLSSRKGNGIPLPSQTLSFMESRFGADFSQVRLHTDSEAVQMSQSINAQAFTHSHDIYFGSGKYDPSSTAGQQLLAHELTHVIQQTGGVQRQPEISVPVGDRIQRDNTAPAAPPATQDADKALTDLLAIFAGSLKAVGKFKHKFETKRKLGSYATLKGVGIAAEISLEAAPKGAALSTGRSAGGSLSTKGKEIDKKGKLAGEEVKVKLKTVMKELFDISFPDIELKWAEEELKGEEFKGNIDLSFKTEKGWTGGVKVDLYKFNLKDPAKSTIGTLTPYGGWQGEVPVIKISIPPTEDVVFPIIEVKGKGKATVEPEIEPNKKEIIVAFVKKFGPKLAERIAMATGDKAAKVASRFVARARSLTGLPASLIVGTLMTILPVLDAFVEGDRIKNLGELAQRLPYVYAGAFLAEKNGAGGGGGGAGGAGGTVVPQFANAGTAAAKKLKQDALAEAKQFAQQENVTIPEPELIAEVDKAVKEMPMGIAEVAAVAQEEVNKYILDRFVKDREKSLLRKGMNALIGLIGGDLGEVKDSEEYKKFKEKLLPAYTQFDPNSADLNPVLKKAVATLQAEGKPINDETLREYFEHRARESEKALEE